MEKFYSSLSKRVKMRYWVLWRIRHLLKKDTIGGEREWFSRGEGSANIFRQTQYSQL